MRKILLSATVLQAQMNAALPWKSRIYSIELEREARGQ
jgi:hypothetical protein